MYIITDRLLYGAGCIDFHTLYQLAELFLTNNIALDCKNVISLDNLPLPDILSPILSAQYVSLLLYLLHNIKIFLQYRIYIIDIDIDIYIDR